MHVNLSEFHMVPCFHTLFTCLSHDFHTHTPSSKQEYHFYLMDKSYSVLVEMPLSTPVVDYGSVELVKGA